MREAFEKWYQETWGKYEMGKPEHIFDTAWNGEYCRMNVRLAWSAWEASRNDNH